MLDHASNPSTQEAEAARALEFESSLVYRASSTTARATQRNPMSLKAKKQQQNPKTNKQTNRARELEQYPQHKVVSDQQTGVMLVNVILSSSKIRAYTIAGTKLHKIFCFKYSFLKLTNQVFRGVLCI